MPKKLKGPIIYKTLKLKKSGQWPEVDKFAKELSKDTGVKFSLPAAVLYAINFTRRHRNKEDL